MDSKPRLILVPQLRVEMRYQDWWIDSFCEGLKPFFSQIIRLGDLTTHTVDRSSVFSNLKQSIFNEDVQICQFLDLEVFPDDILLQLDLSYPGIFSNVLFHTQKVKKCFTFCHATALNAFDIFRGVRSQKWAVERAHARLYQKVFVASKYHQEKLGLKNCVNLGSLPLPPASILPEPSKCARDIKFGSVTRPSVQKVNKAVEDELKELTGEKVVRYQFLDWKGYFQFLDRCEFLVVTSKEETYGYGVKEALMRGCLPIAPKAYSYPELLPDSLLYDNEAPAKVKAALIQEISTKTHSVKPDTQADSFFPRLAEEMLKNEAGTDVGGSE